jgi:N12 class adenine-specific DNA methylase
MTNPQSFLKAFSPAIPLKAISHFLFIALIEARKNSIRKGRQWHETILRIKYRPLSMGEEKKLKESLETYPKRLNRYHPKQESRIDAKNMQINQSILSKYLPAFSTYFYSY